MGVKDIEINIQLCWAEQAFTSTGLSEDANVLPEISILTNAFYNRSCATRSTFAGNKKGRINGVHDIANIEFSWNWWYWPRMRPLLRCHLEIPKNCQISHGTSFNRNLTAVTRWKTEFLCRRPTEGAGRGSEPWHCHLIDPPPLNCTVQPAHPRVIWLSRKGGEVDHEESGISSPTFYKCSGFFGAVRSHVLLLPGADKMRRVTLTVSVQDGDDDGRAVQ